MPTYLVCGGGIAQCVHSNYNTYFCVPLHMSRVVNMLQNMDI